MKNNLPFDIRKSYCQAVDIYQIIRNYEEFKIITKDELILNIRKINEKYSNINEDSGILL